MAQEGNVKALKTGTRTKRYGLAFNQLGKRYQQVYFQCLEIRRDLEAWRREALGLQPHGDLPRADAYLIDGVCLQEMIIRVARSQLAKDPDPSVVAKLLGSIVAAQNTRTSLLTKLGIFQADSAASDPYARLFAPQASPRAPGSQGRGQADPEDLSGSGASQNAAQDITREPGGQT